MVLCASSCVSMCKSAHEDNMLYTARPWLNGRERQIFLWCLVALEIPSALLCTQQSVFISAFNHFPLPVVMCSLFTPWIPLCICPLPPPFFSHTAFSFSLLWDRGGNNKGGRWRMGLKMQIQVISLDWSELITPSTPLQLARGSACFSALPDFISLWQTLLSALRLVKQ